LAYRFIPAPSNAPFGAGKKTDLTSNGAPALPTAVGTEDLVARYEEMRSQVLQGSGRGLGLALLLRHGMKAWIGAWSECRLQSVSKPEEASRRIGVFPAELRSEAVTILAGFALSVWQKEG
jgi:hypothetical protein